MKYFLANTTLLLILCAACKKNHINTCNYDSCDSRRQTVAKAINWAGTLSYYNDLRKWAANVTVNGSYDSTMTCIFCSDIPDSFKLIGHKIIFNGDIKEGCGNPQNAFFGQGIFYVNPINIK